MGWRLGVVCTVMASPSLGHTQRASVVPDTIPEHAQGHSERRRGPSDRRGQSIDREKPKGPPPGPVRRFPFEDVGRAAPNRDSELFRGPAGPHCDVGTAFRVGIVWRVALSMTIGRTRE